MSKELDAIIALANSVPEPPEDLAPEEHMAWLLQHLVGASELHPLLHPDLVALLSGARTPEDEQRVIKAWLSPDDEITGYPDHYIVNGDHSSCFCPEGVALREGQELEVALSVAAEVLQGEITPADGERLWRRVQALGASRAEYVDEVARSLDTIERDKGLL